MIDKKFWKIKKFWLTGHTGFKGAWLSIILNTLGSKVYGYALTKRKNFFLEANLKRIFKKDIRHDLRNITFLKNNTTR